MKTQVNSRKFRSRLLPGLISACSAYSSSFHHRLGLELIVDGAPASSAFGGSLAVRMFLHPSAWIDPLIAYQPIHVFL
jgi:hypothetical protein